uniref:HTH CENPB-type domain-containing protein n=1 Tax=Gopherus agassizii TaxID=38772 RepID=A0A452I0S3_9SAUR
AKSDNSALINWFKLRRNEGVRISGEMVMAQANIFHKELNLQHECDCLQGWLQKFQNRHGISLHCMCSEKRSADTEAAAKYVDKFDNPDVNDKCEFTGFEGSENQKIVSELMEYTSGMSHAVVLELAKDLGEENLLDWMKVNTDAPIANQMMDEEIVRMVQQGKTKDKEEAKKMSVDKYIQLATNLIEGLEQRHFISEQAIMSFYVIREKLIKEKPKYMRQAPLEVWLKVAKRSVEQHSTVRSPVASASSTLNIPTAETLDVT